MIITHCDSLTAAIRTGAEALLDDCAALEIVLVDDDRLVWRGIREEAEAAAGQA